MKILSITGVVILISIAALFWYLGYRTPSLVQTSPTELPSSTPVSAVSTTDTENKVPPAKGILPTKVGQCSKTTIETIGTRLTNSQTGQNIPNSGSMVSYANGGVQVSYSTEPSVQDWAVGDPVDFCLVGLPTNCPVGDERGKTYKVTSLRTGETWEAPNSEHNCGGA